MLFMMDDFAGVGNDADLETASAKVEAEILLHMVLPLFSLMLLL